MIPLRREPSDRPWFDTRRRTALVYHGPRILIGVALAALTYALFPATPAVDFPLYEVGSVATDNVIAPFRFSVAKTDAELQRERETVARGVLPIYRFVPSAVDSSYRRLDVLEARIGMAVTPGQVQQAALAVGVNIGPAEAQYLATPRRREIVFAAVRRVFARWLPTGVLPAGALDQVRGDVTLRTGNEETRVASDSLMTFSMLVSRARLVHPDPGSPAGDAVYMRLLGVAFHPTIVPDAAATEVQREAVRSAIPADKFTVQAGEKIVGANEVVGRDDHEKLRGLRDAVEKARGTEGGGRRVLGAVLFNFLVIALLGLTLLLFRNQVYGHLRWVLALAGIAALVLIGARLVAEMEPSRPELIPVALAAVLLSALFDQRLSMIGAVVLATLIGGQAVFRGTNALFINLLGGSVAAFSVFAIRRRNQAYHWMLRIALGYVVAALAIGLTLDLTFREISTSMGFGALNAVGSVLLAMMLLPLVEAYTGIETDLTLLEWSDLNRPLMQRLSLEAPGTYAHTIAIANLAEAAARAIGANALLARVGAYYHDIGKLARPQYFVENQSKGRNPHDALAPNDSARIIRDHVAEGLALAEQHRIPKVLRAFITEHHGTGSIAYFMEKERSAAGAISDPSSYAYPGPLPQTAETAVVMLADGIEAATRVLSEPTADSIREVVSHIVKQRMEQGQLAEAPLTLRQIQIIKDEFTRVLAGMYHNRIEYPAASGGVTAAFAKV